MKRSALIVLGFLLASCASAPPRPPIVVPPVVEPTNEPPVENPSPILPVPTILSAGESGWLHRDGTRFRTEDGKTWRGRGFSDFRLFQRFRNGEDVAPILDERIALGANYLRVFGMYDGGIGVFHPDAGYLADLSKFLAGLEARGLRCEFVVFADAQRVMPQLVEQRAHLERVAAVLSAHWSALGELVNEWPANGIDPQEFQKPIGQTLWSRGSNTGDGPTFDPPWDYITDHPGRNDEWPRKVECRPIQDAFARPCLEDEPIGASAINQPGRRSNNAEDFAYLGGLCSLWGSGCLFHSDSGIQSQPLGQVELAAARAFFAGLNFAPTEAPFWPYQRGDNCGDCDGIGQMPLAQWDLPHPEGSLRTACRGDGATEWCVAIRPGAQWTPRARRGWFVVTPPADQPRGFVKLSR